MVFSLSVKILLLGEKSNHFLLKFFIDSSFRYFKLIGGKLYIFNKKEDKKAEVVYDLSEWKVHIKETTADSQSTENQTPNGSLNDVDTTTTTNSESPNAKSNNKPHDLIMIENPFQLGCAFKGENPFETLELFHKLNRGVQSF